MDTQLAKDLFQEYKARTNSKASLLDRLEREYPNDPFLTTKRDFWRLAILAEIWGTIATHLSAEKIDYIQNWRTGK